MGCFFLSKSSLAELNEPPMFGWIEIYKELNPLFREYVNIQIKQLLNLQKQSKGDKKTRLKDDE